MVGNCLNCVSTENEERNGALIGLATPHTTDNLVVKDFYPEAVHVNNRMSNKYFYR